MTATRRRPELQSTPAHCAISANRTNTHPELSTPCNGVAAGPSPGQRVAGGVPASPVLLRQRRQRLAGGAAQGSGRDRVRGLDGGHGQQQRHRHDAEEQLPAVRPRHGRRPGHGAVLQRAAAAGLHLRGARPAAARPRLPRPRLRHPGLRPRRLLRLRRHRTRQRHRRRLVSDPAVEGGAVLQGVPAASPASCRARHGEAHRLRRALHRQHRHQRLPRELLPVRDGPVRAVHGGRVRGLFGGAGGAVPRRDPPAGGAAGHLRGAQPHRVPPAGAHAQHAPRRLRRGVQPGGQGLQRQGARHAPPPLRVAAGAQGRIHQCLRKHARPHQQPVHVGAGERRRRVLRDGEDGDVLPVQRREPHDMQGRRQVLLLGLLPSDREGEPVFRQEDTGLMLQGAPVT